MSQFIKFEKEIQIILNKIQKHKLVGEYDIGFVAYRAINW